MGDGGLTPPVSAAAAVVNAGDASPSTSLLGLRERGVAPLTVAAAASATMSGLRMTTEQRTVTSEPGGANFSALEQ
jgi:hypothetical protein